MGYIGLSHAKLSAAANRELLSKIDEISDVTELLRNLWTVWKVESYRRSFTAEICQIRANPRMLLFRKRMYATIPMPVGGIMKRTTVFPDEDVLRKLREVAKRENNTVSEENIMNFHLCGLFLKYKHYTSLLSRTPAENDSGVNGQSDDKLF